MRRYFNCEICENDSEIKLELNTPYRVGECYEFDCEYCGAKHIIELPDFSMTLEIELPL